VSIVFMLLFFVCIYGLFRPFKGLKRWQFGVAAFVSFMLVGVTAPDKDKGKAGDPTPLPSLTPSQAAVLEKSNANEIASLKRQAAGTPPSDAEANLKVYKRLSELAPANGSYSEQVTLYQSKIDARARYEDDPEKALTVDHFDWGTGGFGSIMIVKKLTVSNDAPFAIKDFTLKCVHQGHSGTDMDSNTRTLFEIVPANGKKTFRDVNMGFISSQVATSQCEITSAAKA
jgi:hypothetical protein